MMTHDDDSQASLAGRPAAQSSLRNFLLLGLSPSQKPEAFLASLSVSQQSTVSSLTLPPFCNSEVFHTVYCGLFESPQTCSADGLSRQVSKTPSPCHSSRPWGVGSTMAYHTTRLHLSMGPETLDLTSREPTSCKRPVIA